MKQILDNYKTLKTQKQYLKIILANMINRFGDSIDAIAFTWLVYQITHDAAWSAIIFGVNMIPTILLQPFAGAFVERIRKQKVMILCDIARGIAVTAIAICYLMDVLNPWLLLVITLLNSSFEALRVPAGIAIVPKLLDKDHYDTGTAMNSSLSRVMELIGTGCAGVIIAVMGIQSAILIDAVTFFASAAIIGWIRYSETTSQEKFNFNNYVSTMKEGFRYVTKRQAIVLLCILGAFMNLLAVPLNSFFPAFVGEVLKGDSSMLSVLSLSMTLGMMVGSIAYPFIAAKLTRRMTMIGSIFFSGAVYMVLVMVPQWFPQPTVMTISNVIMFSMFGVVMAIANTSLSVYFMIVVKEDYMARVGSVFNASVTAVIPVCSFLLSALVHTMSLSSLIFTSGVVSLIIGVVFLCMKSMHVLDQEATTEEA